MMRIVQSLGLLLGLCLALAAQAGNELLTVRSKQPFDQAFEQAQELIQKQGYTVAHVQKCDGGLHDMGYATDNYKIIFFGKLDDVRELSASHPELIPFFPFKLAIYAEGNDTLLSVLNPSALAPLLHADVALTARMQSWEEDFRQILGGMQGAAIVAKAP